MRTTHVADSYHYDRHDNFLINYLIVLSLKYLVSMKQDSSKNSVGSLNRYNENNLIAEDYDR